MNRLDRRIAILKGKRSGAFDRHQYYLERAVRGRIARAVRIRLRDMQPLTLVTPRWCQVKRFLDDIATDLLLGEPSVTCRMLNLLPLQGRTQHQAWAWIAQAVQEFCHISISGPVWQAVSRDGFRTTMAMLFERAEGSERRCLMMHGIEHIHVEALKDLIQVFEEHVERTPERRFNLLLAGSVGAPHFAFAAQQRVVLSDFSEREAIEVLVEHFGPLDEGRLLSLVELVGGVPAMLDTLGAAGEDQISHIVADRDAVWRLLGSLAIEIRQAYEIVASDSVLSRRLEQLAENGPQREEPERDTPLLAAGLVKRTGSGVRAQVMMRSPCFADLASLES